jgi:uncharacterized lipoprotein YajG
LGKQFLKKQEEVIEKKSLFLIQMKRFFFFCMKFSFLSALVSIALFAGCGTQTMEQPTAQNYETMIAECAENSCCVASIKAAEQNESAIFLTKAGAQKNCEEVEQLSCATTKFWCKK